MPAKAQSKKEYLQQALAAGRRAEKPLKYSLKKCQASKDLSSLSEQDEEAFEALCSRFARLCDLLIQKIFRAVDAVELVDEGSLLDRLARMEKRGIIKNAVLWAGIRELRNQIAHEYLLEDLSTLYKDVLDHSDELLLGCNAIDLYLKKHGLS